MVTLHLEDNSLGHLPIGKIPCPSFKADFNLLLDKSKGLYSVTQLLTNTDSMNEGLLLVLSFLITAVTGSSMALDHDCPLESLRNL